MPGILTERAQHITNLYWQSGQLIGAKVNNFRQITYLPLPNAVPNLDFSISGARLDCVRNLHKARIEFGKAAKVLMTVLVEYEPVNPLANKHSI